jgi:TP901 family phage tail tape measure protein
MADALIDIAMQFKLGNIEAAMNEFKQATESATISPKIKADRTLILEQFKTIIEEAQKQMAAGTLDPGTLGLSKLVANLETVYRNLGKTTGTVFSEELKNLQDSALKIGSSIEKASQELKDLESKRGNLVPDKIISEAKATTGFSGRAVAGGSLGEAKDQLQKLEALEKAGSKEKGLGKKVKFYKELVALYIKAKKDEIKLNNSIKKSEDNITTLKKEQLHIQQQINIEQQKTSGQETPEMKKLASAISNTTKGKNSAIDVSKKLTKEIKSQTKANKDATDTHDNESKSLTAKATAAFSYYLVFNQLKRIFNDTLRTIKQLDKAMTDAAIVTSMNRKEAWALLGSYQQLAKATGLATSEIATTVTQFLRQGRSVKDAMQLTEVAAKSAKVAGISAQEAVNYLTSAVNGFGLAASQSEQIADKFAAIAAQSATSFQELALAMSKVSPTAKSAGVSVDFMMGVIAKGIETTREAPENIGTAFKTIFARMREVTDLGKAMEDGMDLNRVEKALGSIGVPLRDVSGQFRNLEQVLIDVGEKWDTLTSVEQAYLATALAGSRQQPRLLAIFNDFARTKELIQISADATGELANQHIEYMKGSEAALANLRTAWQQLTMSFVDIEIVVVIIQKFTEVLEGVSKVIQGQGDSMQWFKTILIAVAVAYGVLTSAKLMDILFSKIQNLVTAGSIASKKKLAVATNMTTASFKALTLQQKVSILTDLMKKVTVKSLTAALWLKVKALGATIKALAILLIKMAPLIAIGAVAAIVIREFSRANKEASKTAEHFATKVQETNNEISRLAAKEREVKKLTDRFSELAQKTALSTQELEEMKSIGEELSKIELDGEVFNISRKEELTGKIVIDDSEMERYKKFISDRRNELINENLSTFRGALAKDFEGTLNNKTLMNVFKSIGYNFGEEFLNGFTDGLDAELEGQLTTALNNLTTALSPDLFKEQQDAFRFAFDWMDSDNLREKLGDKVFATQEEAMAELDSLFARGDINEDEYRRMGGRGERVEGGVQARSALAVGAAGAGVGAAIGSIIPGIGTAIGAGVGALVGFAVGAIGTALTTTTDNLNKVVVDGINEEAMKKTIDDVMLAFKNGYEGLNEATKDILADESLSNLEKTSQIFAANANTYKDIVDEINASDLTTEQKTVAIDAVGATMQDGAILDNLINKKGIDVNVIAKMSVDLSLKDIEEIFEDFDKDFLSKTRTITVSVSGGRHTNELTLPALTTEQQEEHREELAGILGDLFSDSAEGVEAGFDKLKEFVDNMIELGVMTAEEGERMIINLSNKIKTLSLEDAASLLKDQMDLANSLFKLSSDLAKGDFSSFSKLVETYGLENTKAVLSKNTDQIEQFFDEQNQSAIEKINEAIEKIKGTARSLGRVLTEQEAMRIEAYEIMIEYYDVLATQEQLRNFRLTTARDLLKQMNDTLSIQQKLSDLGLSGGIFDIFNEMADNYYSEGMGFLIEQVQTDLDNLDRYLGDDGFFDPDSLGIAEGAIQNAMSSLNELIDSVTAAYARQKKVIEDRYKGEIDAIKQSHSDRWSVIDYTDRLGEAEDKILQARRRLMGMAISGVSKGVLDQTEKDLKKLQQERQKIIEEQMVKKAEEDLKKEMDEKLLEVQTELASVLTQFSDELEKYQNVLLKVLEGEVIPDTALTGTNLDPEIEDPDLGLKSIEAMEGVIDSNIKVVRSQDLLRSNLMQLTDAILTKERTLDNGNPFGMTDPGTIFKGMGKLQN